MAALVEAGALPGSVYTRDELSILVEAKRVFNAELKGVAIRATMPVPGVLQDRCHHAEPTSPTNGDHPFDSHHKPAHRVTPLPRWKPRTLTVYC
jgi:hypothetical protein